MLYIVCHKIRELCSFLSISCHVYMPYNFRFLKFILFCSWMKSTQQKLLGWSRKSSAITEFMANHSLVMLN